MKPTLTLLTALLLAPLAALHAGQPAKPFPARAPLTKPTDRPLSATIGIPEADGASRASPAVKSGSHARIPVDMALDAVKWTGGF